MNIVRTIVLLVAAVVLLGGCAAGNRGGQNFKEFAYGKDTSLDLSAEKHVQIARGYLARGNSEQAYMHLTKAQEKAPQDMDIHALKGELLIDQRQDELALNEFLIVLEAVPDHAAANQGAGIIYFRAGLYKEAEAHLSLAVTRDDSLWKAHNYLGILYDRRGDYDLAADAFSSALNGHQGKEAPAILNNLGMVHMARKDYGLAVQAFKRALQEGPPSSRIYNNLGVALAHGGNYAEALEAFRFASNEYVACNNLGFVLLSGGQPGEAIPYFERALELAPSFYTKASENLKRARMASRFGASGEIAGSTPNQLSPDAFPSEGQTVDGAAATVKTIAAPSSDALPAPCPGWSWRKPI
ncbi:tetratricopeptide repeat protein [Salidesulfovibrio onnuriiensis]|uniref:tetratricopeptide repeat protein n=1 Tax=Salidesulfovibrio onnuriiensis TaxID=2583823 RepID=UPI0011C9BE43|nr:tetratricopeptide repeat protein [Salidesulfovibrio onnuriiensis]